MVVAVVLDVMSGHVPESGMDVLVAIIRVVDADREDQLNNCRK